MSVYEIDVVRKAVTVLRALAQSKNGVGVSELARSIGLGKATVFRILQTLADQGLVQQDSDNKRYRLGAELVVLGQAASETLDFRLEARPIMEALSREAGMPTYLNVAGNLEVVCLEHVRSLSGIDLYGAAGHTMPYHACPSGLLLLAFGPEDRLQRVLSRGLARYGKQTIDSAPELEAMLAVVRKQGYALGTDDLEDGVTSLAAPIYDVRGRVVATLGLAGFSHQFVDGPQALVGSVLEAARRISPVRPPVALASAAR